MRIDLNDPSTVGSILRAGREEKSVSLDELASITRIRLSILRDLEKDEFERLPSSVYLVGFINLICDALEIDPRHARDAYYRQTAIPDVELMPDTRIPIGLGRRPSYRALLVLIAILGAAVLGTNILYRTYRSPAPAPAATVAPTPATSAPNVLPPFREASPTIEPTPDAMVLEAIADMNVNVRVTVDGRPAFSGFMNPGERRAWSAAESISLVTDNAAGLRVELNGRPLGRLGGVGQRFEGEWHAPP